MGLNRGYEFFRLILLGDLHINNYFFFLVQDVRVLVFSWHQVPARTQAVAQGSHLEVSNSDKCLILGAKKIPNCWIFENSKCQFKAKSKCQ